MDPKYDLEVQSDEIDLIDLIKILYKHRFFAMIIVAIVTLFSLGGAIYVKNSTKNLVAINFALSEGGDEFYLEKSNININDFNVDNALKNDSIIKKLFELPETKSLFEKTGDKETSFNKRLFLEKIIKQTFIGNKEEGGYYQVSIEYSEDNKDEIEILDTYINSINESFSSQYTKIIDKRYENTRKKREGYKEKLNTLTKEIQKVIQGESKELFNNELAMEIMSLKYPELFEEQKKYRELYEKYNNEVLGMEGIREEIADLKRVERVSSYYEIEGKSKAKMILVIGVLLGIVLGILGAFFKEFWMKVKREVME